MSTRKKYKGISRIDQEDKRTHGWYVRVGFSGSTVSKFFADAKFGGKKKSLDKALEFRDKSEKKMGKPRTDRIVVATTVRNRTGIVGVHRKIEKVRDKDGKMKERKFYEITWSPAPYLRGKTTVSIDAHGEEKAYQKAFRIRKAKEKEIYGKAIRKAKQ